MLTGTGERNHPGCKLPGFIPIVGFLPQDIVNLVVKEKLLVLLCPVGRADHWKTVPGVPAILHHLPADGGAARVHHVVAYHSVQLRHIALRQRGIGAYDHQQVQLKILQPILFPLRQSGHTGRRGILRIADLLKRTVNLIQCHADDRRCLALGGSHLADLQQNLHQEPGTDGYGNQRKRNEDFFFGRQHFLHGTETNPPPDGGH